jgi:sodium-dependent dicarboxylate transporter 2/3/5
MADIGPTGPAVSARSTLIKGAIAMASGVGVMLVSRPEDLSPEGHRLLALLTTVVILWVTEAVPIGVTALMAGAGLILFNIQTPQSAWGPFASPAVMFVLMIIMFGVVLTEVGLAKRLIYHLIRFAGTKIRRLSLILAIGCSISSSIFHDATITVIMVFAFVPVFRSMGLKPGMGHRLPMFFFLLIPLSSSAGGFGTLLGGGRNPLALQILQSFSQGQISIGFLEYILIQFPICVVTALATWVLLWVILRPEEKELVGVKMSPPAPWSPRERGVLVVFLLTFVVWFLGDLTGWHYSVPAAIALFGFCAPGWVSFRSICDKFPWEAWIVFGAGVSLGVAMLDSGAGQYLGEAFLPVLDGKPTFVAYYGMGLFGSTLSSAMSNSAAVALMLPITLPMAGLMSMSPQAVAMLAPQTTSFIMVVVGCPPTIIAYTAGYFNQKDFTKVAVPWTLFLLLVCTLCATVYWPMIGFTS